MPPRRPNAIRLPRARDQRALIDLCYRLDLDDAAFLTEIGAWWQRLGPAGPLGALAVSVQCDGAGQVVIDPVRYGRHETFALYRKTFSAAGDRNVRGMLSYRPQFGAAARVPDSEDCIAVAKQHGIRDFVGFLAPTGTGHVILLGTPIEEAAAEQTARNTAMGACAMHLAASWRLRRRLLADDRWASRAEAVALPDGRVVHAVGEARAPEALATLRRMVLARERARSGTRTEVEPLWPELVAGRWTLVDSFDHAHRRYVVAYRNPPDARRTPLSPRAQEVLSRTARGQSTKLIAAHFGVSEAAVSITRHAAMKSLRIERVADLIRLGAETPAEAILCDEALTAVALESPARRDLDALTEAEREVLGELLRGASNHAIAARRNRSAHTVANQVGSVFAKLGVGSRRELMAKVATRA